jgi:hypothetical protein
LSQLLRPHTLQRLRSQTMQDHMSIALCAVFLPQAADTSSFQQGVDYRIEATLDDAIAVLRGRARLRYSNRSRTRLDPLYSHEHLTTFQPNSHWARRGFTPAGHSNIRLVTSQICARPMGPGARASKFCAAVTTSCRSPAGWATWPGVWTQIVTIDTRERPGQVVLDPDFVLIDSEPGNHRKGIP